MDIVRMSGTELRRDLLPSEPDAKSVKWRLDSRLVSREIGDDYDPRNWRLQRPTLWQRLRACVGL